jgi:CheY-like chemotaxis protein
VLAAESGTEALELVRTESSIALLITDVVLPGIRGPELVERARALRPDLRFIYTSGYADDVLRRAHGLPNDAVLLEKPYQPSTLLRTVRELLDRRPP